MDVHEAVACEVRKRGITTAELSRRTGVRYEALRRFLAGKQDLRNNQFVKLSQELGLEMSDFYEKSA